MIHNGPLFTMQCAKMYKDKTLFFLPAEISFDAQRCRFLSVLQEKSPLSLQLPLAEDSTVCAYDST